MKKFLLLLLLFSITIMTFGCNENNSESLQTTVTTTASTTNADDLNNDLTDKNGKLFINGVDVTDKCYVRFNLEDNYAKLGLVSILKELGAEIAWQSETTAHITIDDSVLVLNMERKTLSDINEEQEDILLLAPGASYDMCREIVDNDLIVDDSSLLLLFDTYLNISHRIDISNLTVSLSASK